MHALYEQFIHLRYTKYLTLLFFSTSSLPWKKSKFIKILVLKTLLFNNIDVHRDGFYDIVFVLR